VILPLACVENSRYLDCDMFNRMMESLGFALLEQKLTAKLAMFVYKVVGEPIEVTFGRTLVRAGTTRNNFCIMLQPEHDNESTTVDSKKRKKAKPKKAERQK
jgi:25S rRNA (adenine2142-N1)-methyltransferase